MLGLGCRPPPAASYLRIWEMAFLHHSSLLVAFEMLRIPQWRGPFRDFMVFTAIRSAAYSTTAAWLRFRVSRNPFVVPLAMEQGRTAGHAGSMGALNSGATGALTGGAAAAMIEAGQGNAPLTPMGDLLTGRSTPNGANAEPGMRDTR